MKTYMASAETADKEWYIADASGKVLGRFASEIAHRLRGKHKCCLYSALRYRRFYHCSQCGKDYAYRKKNVPTKMISFVFGLSRRIKRNYRRENAGGKT